MSNSNIKGQFWHGHWRVIGEEDNSEEKKVRRKMMMRRGRKKQESQILRVAPGQWK